MKSVALVALVFPFALMGSTTCYYIGGGTDSKWSTAANWKDGVVPSAGDIVEVSNAVENAQIEIDRDFSVARINVRGPKAVALAGDGKLTVTGVGVYGYAPMTVGNDIHFTAANANIKPGPSSGMGTATGVFTGSITIADGTVLAVGGSAKLTFEGTITGRNATLRMAQLTDVWSGYNYFKAPVKVKKLEFSPAASRHEFHFYAQGNEWESCVLEFSTIWCEAENVLPEDGVISFSSSYRENGPENASYFLKGFNQVADRISSGDVKGKFSDFINANTTWYPNDKAATLTLKGTADASTYCCLTGAVSLIWTPVGDFTQSFVGRSQNMSGRLTVSNGTLRVASGATFKRVCAVDVEGGTLKLDESGANAFAGADAVRVAAGGKIVFTAGTPNAFSPEKTVLNLETGAVVEVPAGVSCAVKSVYLDGKQIPIGDYCQNDRSEGVPCDWVTGGGWVSVRTGIEAPTATWTGGGEDEKTSTAKNWDVGVPVRGAPLVFADGGERAFLTEYLYPEKITFRAAQPGRMFSIADDISAPNAAIALGAGGLTFEGTGGQTNVISCPLRFRADSSAWTMTGTKDVLKISGTIDSLCPQTGLTLNGNGGAVYIDGNLDYCGTATFTDATCYMSGSAFGEALTNVRFVCNDGKKVDFCFRGGKFDAPITLSQNNSNANYGRLSVTANTINEFSKLVSLADNWWNQQLALGAGAKAVFAGGLAGGYTALQIRFNGANSEVIVTNKPISAIAGASSTAGIKVLAWDVGTLTLAAPDNHLKSGALELTGKVTLRTVCDWALSTNTVAMPLLLSTESDQKGAKVDLCGHDQAIGELKGGTKLDSTATITSATPATLHVLQNGQTVSTIFTPTFKGAASLCKCGTNELVLAGVSTTTGGLEVVSGKVSFSGNGSWGSASKIAVSGGELFLDAPARVNRKADCHLMGGKLNIPANVTVRVRGLFVREDGSLIEKPAGYYSAANLPDFISGGGALFSRGTAAGMMLIVR